MDVHSIAKSAQLKGLDLVGTGDFTHPDWMSELEAELTEISNSGLYRLTDTPTTAMRFMVTAEVCTIFPVQGKSRRIHHIIFTPHLAVAKQISDRLHAYGNLAGDGRPILHMSASELVETVLEVSPVNAVIPAHVWTPWYSLFGAKHGFDRIEDCYEDMTRHIFALETGLSSDPPMNWRISALDRFTLISNSDAHSPYPYRLGREANVLEVDEARYDTILDVLRHKDGTRLKFTVETDPAYGKYHWTGHHHCGVALPPSESQKLNGLCPVCRRPLTKGVDERTQSLADRPDNVRPDNALDYRHLLPLQEMISAVMGIHNLYSSQVWQRFNALIAAFGDEYTVLLETPLDQLQAVVEPQIASAILRIRNDDITVHPGYDGVYGEIALEPTFP
jgi:uncharacterized protein (TIGR00375 family)